MAKKNRGQIESIIRDEANRFFLYLESGVYDKNHFSFDMLTKIILYSISQFVTEENELSDVLDDKGKHFLSKENWENFRKNYSGDSTLFEIGCFLYFLIDQWLRENKPEINESIFFNHLLNGFIKRFNKIFGHVNSRDFYKQRYSKYREVEEERGAIEDYYFYVEQLVYLTEDNAQPEKHDFGTIATVPFTHKVWIKIQFFAWYKSVVPTMYENIKLFIKSFEENSP